jgi:leader peptidase (prepilin peptidase)/N-methyltransferase
MQEIFHTLSLLLQDPKILILCVLFLGLLIGSFLNVVIYRLPLMMEREWSRHCEESESCVIARRYSDEAIHKNNDEKFNLLLPYSHCPHCKKTIRPWENIPIISYICLRGKCSQCKASIPLRYPLVELLTALLSVFLAYHYGFSLALLATLGLTWLLIALTFIDIDTHLLPDDLTYLGLWAGLFFSLYAVFVTPSDAIVGAICGYVSLWSLYWIFKWVTHKEGMGYGDFKLMALAGAWVGWQYLPLVILIASFTGALFGITKILFMKAHKDHPLPFGPFIALGTWLTVLYGDKLFDSYVHWVI